MIEIPEFLLEMSEQLNTQDNRITAHPIWMVCYDKEYPTSQDYGEFYQWVDVDNEYNVIYSSNSGEDETEELIKYLLEYEDCWVEKFINDHETDELDGYFDMHVHYDELPKTYEQIWINKKQEVVKACLTEADANWFIKRKQHDYPKLYTYVFSMYHCPQMIELRNWIKSLTPCPEEAGKISE